MGRSFQKLRQPLTGSTCGFRFRLRRRSRTIPANQRRRGPVTQTVPVATADAADAGRGVGGAGDGPAGGEGAGPGGKGRGQAGKRGPPLSRARVAAAVKRFLGVGCRELWCRLVGVVPFAVLLQPSSSPPPPRRFPFAFRFDVPEGRRGFPWRGGCPGAGAGRRVRLLLSD